MTKTPDKAKARLETELRLFHRLLISYNDFKHAVQISDYILKENLHNRRNESRILHEALNCAMIISYCRPFSGNDKRTKIKIPDLPKRFLKGFSVFEKEVHNTAMEDRNTVLAHSDSSGWNLRPVVLVTGGKKTLIPWSNDTRAPLIKKATKTLNSISIKLREKIFKERMKLEAKLLDSFEILQIDDKKLEEMKKKISRYNKVQGDKRKNKSKLRVVKKSKR